MDGEPGEPRRKAAHVRLEGPFDFSHRRHAADGGHIALVEVAEGRARPAGEVGGDDFGDVIAHLHGGLGHAGNLMAVLLEVGQVAEDKDLGQSRRVEPVVDDDAAAAIKTHFGRRAQHLAQRRGLHACGPKRDGGFDPEIAALAVGFNPSGTDGGDLRFGVHFDAQPFECGFGFRGEVLRIGGQHAG